MGEHITQPIFQRMALRLAGTLPFGAGAGLTLSAAGVISGTPTATATANFTIRVQDANGCFATQTFSLMPNCTALTVNPATLPNGTVGAAYSQTLTVTGATGAVTWTVSAGTLARRLDADGRYQWVVGAAHFLFEDGNAAKEALEAAGIKVLAVRDVVVQPYA